MRPIPRGRVSRPEALVFGLILAAGAIIVLGPSANIAAVAHGVDDYVEKDREGKPRKFGAE